MGGLDAEVLKHRCVYNQTALSDVKRKGKMEQSNNNIKNEVRLLSVKEAGSRLGIGHWTVYQLIHQHALKTVKIGKRQLISSRAIDEFITGQERYGA